MPTGLPSTPQLVTESLALDFDLDFTTNSSFLLDNEPLDGMDFAPIPSPRKRSPVKKQTIKPKTSSSNRPRLRNFQCTHPGCGKSFADNAHLKDHMFVHTGEKSLQCPECQKCFARAASLKSHRRVHTGERPFLCMEPECNKQYASRAALRMHSTLHAKKMHKKTTKKTSTGCDDCSSKECHRGRCRRMAEKIKEQRQVILDLQAQLDIAKPSPPPPPTEKKPQEKPFKPMLVPMVAPLYLLQDGIKPFTCMAGCGRSFSNYFQLAFHAKQHPDKEAHEVLGDQLPFPVGPKYCPVVGCEFSEENGKSMKTLQIVKRHWQRVHQNTRPFLCPDCPPHAQKAFKTRDNLTAHRKECKKRTETTTQKPKKETPLKRTRQKSGVISPQAKKRSKNTIEMKPMPESSILELPILADFLAEE